MFGNQKGKHFFHCYDFIKTDFDCSCKSGWKQFVKTSKWCHVSKYMKSISSTFYTHIFCSKVLSKPNSKPRKAAQFTFVQKMCV